MKWRLIKSLVGSFWKFIEPILKIYLTRWGRILFETALAAVAEAEEQSRSGNGWTRDEKRAYVIAQLKGNDFGAGFPIADRVIELVIRLAVMSLQPNATRSSFRQNLT